MVRHDFIEKTLKRAFYKYGRFVARHPLWFLVCPVLLTMALGSGFYNFHAEYDVEKLFTPEGARSKDERSVVQSLFSDNERSDEFSATRMSTMGEYGRIIVTSKTAGGNILTNDVFDEVEQLDKQLRNISVEVSGKPYSFCDLCARSCDIATSELFVLHNDLSVNLEDVSYPVHTYQVSGSTANNITFFLASAIGGVSKTAAGGTAAKAWSLFYYLRTDEAHDEAVIEWQDKFLSIVVDNSYTHIALTRFTAHSLEDELQRNTNAVLPLFTILFTVLITFTIVSCLSVDWVRSKPWLGNLGVLSAGLAVVSGFGLVLHADVPFIDIVASGPFLVLGKQSIFHKVPKMNAIPITKLQFLLRMIANEFRYCSLRLTCFYIAKCIACAVTDFNSMLIIINIISISV